MLCMHSSAAPCHLNLTLHMHACTHAHAHSEAQACAWTVKINVGHWWILLLCPCQSVQPVCLVCISVCLPVTFSVYLLFTFNLSSDFEQQTLQYRVLSANPVGCDAYFYLNVLTGRVSPARPLYNSGFDNCVVGFSLQNYVRCVCVFVCVCVCFSI